MSVSNSTDELCHQCDGTVECAPTAVLLMTLIHTLYGALGSEPDYFGNKLQKNIPNEHMAFQKDITLGRTLSIEKEYQHNEEQQSRRESDDIQVYDFVVVGGGTAGCILASRLSENKKWKVLLLEAGPEQPKLTLIPALAFEFPGSVLDWQFVMRPKNGFCQNQKNGCEVVQGRVLGGTSSINNMVYLRGSPSDYNEWALLGNEGWDFNSVLPFFKYSEGNYDNDIFKNSYFHSTQGPLDVGRYPHIDENVDVLLSALSELGLNYTDLNGRNQLGFMRVQTFSYFGERVSTQTAFIEPIVNVRSNLDVMTESLATKIILERNGDIVQAVGVQYMRNGTKFKVLAAKDVIISAGAINSPKLLMQSGLGPKSYLDYLNTPVFLDLPVGSNLHDHLSVCLPVIKLGKTSTKTSFTERLNDVKMYYGKGTGPLSANFQVLALFETKLSQAIGSPDIAVYFKGHASPMYYDRMDLCISLLTPKSRGQIMLNATDPDFGSPLIYPNFLKDYNDVKKLLEGIQIAINLFDTQVFKKSDFEFDPISILDNECKDNKRVTDDFWLCIIKHFSGPMHNYVGTCKMGPWNDAAAVVDNKLKVYGVDKLRVVDASIIPTITRAPTAAAVMMIAEKASEIIKTFWY